MFVSVDDIKYGGALLCFVLCLSYQSLVKQRMRKGFEDILLTTQGKVTLFTSPHWLNVNSCLVVYQQLIYLSIH